MRHRLIQTVKMGRKVHAKNHAEKVTTSKTTSQHRGMVPDKPTKSNRLNAEALLKIRADIGDGHILVVSLRTDSFRDLRLHRGLWDWRLAELFSYKRV